MQAGALQSELSAFPVLAPWQRIKTEEENPVSHCLPELANNDDDDDGGLTPFCCQLAWHG